MNDMVRLASALNEPFPFKEYAGVRDFPRIEVEFFHLKDKTKSQAGRFMLLDTPGFNEAGQQEHLLPMMEEQLQKATAVLAVLDYSQLSSESEGKLRKALNDIAEQADDRLFVLVNKFDQKDKNSLDEGKTRAFVAKKLLSETKINEKNIFPVSSQWAYLAQRALVALNEENGIQWQEGQPESWIDDFGDRTFGVIWQEEIRNARKVGTAAQKLWEKSLFDQPLEKVIHYGYHTAAYQAVAGASGMLDANAQELYRFIEGRLQAQAATPQELKELIESAREQIQRLEQVRMDYEAQLREQFDSLQKKMKEKMDEASEDAKDAIAKILKKKSGEKEGFFGKAGRKRTFEEKNKATEIVRNARKELTDSINKASDEIMSYAEDSMDSLDSIMKDIVRNIKREISSFSKSAKEANLSTLAFELPRGIRLRAPNLHDDMDEDDFIERKTSTRKVLREQNSLFGWFKRKIDFFDAEWGYDEEEVTEDEFILDEERMIAYCEQKMESALQTLQKQVENNIIKPLQQNSNEFFALVQENFDQVRQILQNGLNDQQRDKAEAEQIQKELKKLINSMSNLKQDCKTLKDSAKKNNAGFPSKICLILLETAL